MGSRQSQASTSTWDDFNKTRLMLPSTCANAQFTVQLRKPRVMEETTRSLGSQEPSRLVVSRITPQQVGLATVIEGQNGGAGARRQHTAGEDDAGGNRAGAPGGGAAARAGTAHRFPMLQSGYITGYTERNFAMSSTPQERALNNYRKRLKQRGLARFEVLGLDGDRDLIRSLANRLAGDGPDSARIRAAIRRTITGEPPKKGGILNALRRSPLVGADLDLKRPVTAGRKVDL